MAEDLFATLTVLAPPSGARVKRDLVYDADARGDLRLDVYQPGNGRGPWPAVLLVNGDADETTIARAKDWGVYRSYGEHLAARGIVGVPFNHRSTKTVGRAAVAAEFAKASEYVRGNATDLAIDPDRIGVWAFSAAGAFALAPLIRDRPAYVRAIAGFYTFWDLEPFRITNTPAADQTIREWSTTAAIGDSAAGLAPILAAVAGRDTPQLVSSAWLFVARARHLGADIRIFDHPTGQHGFDIRDDDERSREIIAAALDFFAAALDAAS